MSKQKEPLVQTCPECGSSGVEPSYCCEDAVENGRCLGCGRFYREEVCRECDGFGCNKRCGCE